MIRTYPHRNMVRRYHKRGNPEGQLVLQILHYLRACGHVAGKIKTQGSPKVGGGFIFDPYRMTGLPDIFCFTKSGQLIGIECKAGKNNPTPNQEEFGRLFHLPPTRLYIIARCLEDVQKIIQ